MLMMKNCIPDNYVFILYDDMTQNVRETEI